MTTTAIGRRAENVAADHLKSNGYVIVEQNWRRRECEIDIVAQKDHVVYFVEVKFRMNDENGSGLEYIGPQKLRQMEYAARRWVAEHSWRGEHTLAAIEVSGAQYQVTGFIDSICG